MIDPELKPIAVATGPVPSPTVAGRLLLVLVATLAVVVPALIVVLAPPSRIVRRPAELPSQRIVPPAELPPVEPVKFVAVTPDDARAYNETIPFSTAPNPAARPFKLADAADDRQRAIDCLAAAVIYEAGDDAVGERAVAQVVINRVRHPAFPKSICGVVFQGSDRSTGCQFTFTCDGALARWKPSDAAWKRGQEIAEAALSGSVDKPIGYSTHYHTDWVVPYWSSSLDKVARVETHLFFRWTGWWGTPPAFGRQVSDVEPIIPALAPFSPVHTGGEAVDGDDFGTVPLDATQIANGGLPSPIASDADTFLVTLDPAWSADSFAALAVRTCGERPYCKFMAWPAKATTPTAVPLTPQQVSTMAFSYLRDRVHDYDKALWNCATFKRDDKTQCMKRQVLLTASAPASSEAAAPKVAAPAAAPDPLVGIHRKNGAPAPQPASSPAPLPQ